MIYIPDVTSPFNAPCSGRQWIADQYHSPQRDQVKNLKAMETLRVPMQARLDKVK